MAHLVPSAAEIIQCRMIITEKINGKCGKGRPCAISEYAWKY
jgi:hypothetical protein